MLTAIVVFDSGKRRLGYRIVNGKRETSGETFRISGTVETKFLLGSIQWFSTGITKWLFYKRDGRIADGADEKTFGRDFFTDGTARRIEEM